MKRALTGRLAFYGEETLECEVAAAIEHEQPGSGDPLRHGPMMASDDRQSLSAISAGYRGFA
jgi:hypothetical protein